MEDIYESVIFLIFNVIGATIRWIFGSIWRSSLRKPKVKFKEYLIGSKSFDLENNFLIGFITAVIITVLIATYIY